MDNLVTVSQDLKGLEIEDSMSSQNLGSVSFEIAVKESTKEKSRPPKRVLAARKALEQRSALTIENLHKKQQQAEERRMKRKAEKLARIHQRQEAAREMAKNVEILLQQKALCQENAGSLVGAGVQRMSVKEIMSTAKKVELNFYRMRHEINSDLSVDKTVKTFGAWKPVNENQKIFKDNEKSLQHEENENKDNNIASGKSKGGVSFTVVLDEDTDQSRKPKKIPALRNGVKQHVSEDDLHYKQAKAEERRIRKLQLRTDRVRANRDTYLQLHGNLAQLKQYQDISSRDDVDSAEVKAANREAAKLANQIADTFDSLAQRYKSDLERTDGFPCININLS